MVFSHHWIDILGEKSYWLVVGWWWWPVGLYCQSQSHSFSSGLWILDLGLGFGTWIWDLDFGLGFGNGLGLDNCRVKVFEHNINAKALHTLSKTSTRSNWLAR